MPDTPQPVFFASVAELRGWFETNHASSAELWIGYYKKASGGGGVTYKQAVDEALCFGWIDGQVRRLDARSYANRYTPRRERSVWSNVNTKRFLELEKLGRITPAGRRAFAARDPARTGIYAYEIGSDGLDRRYLAQLKKHPSAWRYFQQQPPHYRRKSGQWVMSAKQPETRDRRFAQLLADCGAGRWIKGFIPVKPKS